MFKKIPTYDDVSDEWGYTEFETQEKYLEFLWSLFKEPGKYEFDKTSFKFNKQARYYNNYKIFTVAPSGTADYINYWNTEKEKCRQGVIYKNSKNTWFLPRDYYMWLNFLPLYNKEIGKFGFPDVRDAQYHIALYEELASYSNKHCAILKKRQIASSYYHAGKIINLYFFEEGAVCKMAASLKDYISEKGTWRFLEEYRNFLNQHTAWYRPSTPDKIFNWEQKIEIRKEGRKIDVGLKSIITGHVLDKDVTNGVGGPCTLFFHEEGGIAPKADQTVEYLLPALKSGVEYTGMFVIAGSVGDLDACEPLKEMILNPDSKDVLAVHTNLIDDEGQEGMCGLFIPEQWSMKPCIDEYGNSLVEEALDMIFKEREKWKKQLKPSDYQLRISQKPTNIKEAFDYRTESVFPLHLVSKQIREIEEGNVFSETIELKRDENNKITINPTKRRPIRVFPLPMNTVDKRGAVEIFERPVDKLTCCTTYYASVDPVSSGKTTTSNSLASVIIYKTPQEVIKVKQDGSRETIIEQDKIVASWCGRFDDVYNTNEEISMLIELYQAWAIVENNISSFIQYMMEKNRQKFLVPKNQIAFLKELNTNTNVFQEYGWRNVGRIFKDNMIPYGVEFIEEELDKDVDENGNISNIIYGITKIPDIMILKEMVAYRDGVNVDRLITYCSLVAFARIQKTSRGFSKRIEIEESDKSLHLSNKNSNLLKRSPFTNINRPSSKNKYRRSAFKNFK